MNILTDWRAKRAARKIEAQTARLAVSTHAIVEELLTALPAVTLRLIIKEIEQAFEHQAEWEPAVARGWLTPAYFAAATMLEADRARLRHALARAEAEAEAEP